MFTYVNSKKTAIFFDVELRKILLDHKEETTVTLVIGRVGHPDHKIELGSYQPSKELLEGLSGLDHWTENKVICLDDIRRHLRKNFDVLEILS